MAEESEPFFVAFDDYDPEASKKHLRGVALEPLSAVSEALGALADWTPEAIQNALTQTAESLEISFGKIGMPLRVALVGHGQSPAINQTLWLLGQAVSLKRIEKAIEWIQQRVQAQANSS